jgi:hypothetical protein
MNEDDTWSFWAISAFALVALAVISPISYCTIQKHASNDSVRLACIEAKGTWAWGECTFPEEKK